MTVREVVVRAALVVGVVAAFALGYEFGRTDARLDRPILCGEDSIRVAPRYVPRGPVPGATP